MSKSQDEARQDGGTSLLARMVQLVTFLFAAFGGVLTGIAPPEEARVGFAVGIGSFLSLGVLLFVASVSHGLSRRIYKRRWLIASAAAFVCALVLAMVYYCAVLRYTFSYPTENSPDKYVAGTEMTPAARDYLVQDPGRSVAALVLDFGGLEQRSEVWTAASRRRASLILMGLYIALVISLATSIFCLTEGVLPRAMAGRPAS